MNTILHPNQDAMAKALGIDASKMASPEEAIIAIETKLGGTAMVVRSRWFVISVLRHLKKARWSELEQCALSEEAQLELAKAALAVDGFATSLRTVTKDSRTKFRFVGFASSKNIERGMLATGTKAYKLALAAVEEAGLLLESAPAPGKQSPTKPSQEPKRELASAANPKPKRAVSKVQNRPESEAARPSSSDVDAAAVSATADMTGGQSSRPAPTAMSKEEFESLDAALSRSDTEIVQQNWTDQSNEDHWSRILGIVAGVGFLVFIALLFL